MTQAAQAVASAVSLGIGGNIVYADLEYYNETNQSCSAAAAAYVSGWVFQLDVVDGQASGIYTSTLDAHTWGGFGGLLPDDVWLTKADNRVTIWGLTLSNGTGTQDGEWPNNQRVHQFQTRGSIIAGGHGYSPIDRDIEDATIVAGNVTKNPILSPFQIDYVACQTAWYGINNYNQLAGQFIGTQPPYSFQGLLDYSPLGGNGWQLVAPAGLMSSLNNQCRTGQCAYPSLLQNTAVGYQVPVPELPRGRTARPFRHGRPAPDNRPSPANGSCGGGDITCGVVVVQGQQPAIFNCARALGSELNGVSDDPQFVGTWWNDSAGYGFVSPDATGQHCYSFNPTGSIATWVGGVNGDGEVVGSFMDANQQVHGFIYNYGGGTDPPAPVPFDYPEATTTVLIGINNNGVILGYADLASGGGTYFLYDENNDMKTPLSYPENYTFNGLNDTSYMAGFTGSQYGCADGLLLESALVP